MEKIFIKNHHHHQPPHHHHHDWNIPLETRLLLNEKDLIIRKQQDKIQNLELKLSLFKRQYENLVSLLKIPINDQKNKPITIDTLTLENLRNQHEQIDSQLLINSNSNSSNNDDEEEEEVDDYEDEEDDYVEDNKITRKTDNNVNNNNNKKMNDLSSIDVMNNNNNNKNNTTTTTTTHHNVIDSSSTDIEYKSKSTDLLNIKREPLRLIDELDLSSQHHRHGHGLATNHKRIESAATKIQTAYRQFKLKKNYLKIYENSIKRRSLDIEKLNSLNYSLSESSSESCCSNKILTPSTSSSSSTSSPSVPAVLKQEQNAEQKQNQVLATSVITSTATDLASIDFENSIENFNNDKNLLLLSTSSLVSQHNIDSIDAVLVNEKPIGSPQITIEAAVDLIKEQLDSVIETSEPSESTLPLPPSVIQTQQFFNGTQSNSCSSVHSVFSNSTLSSKCSYLSSASSISATSTAAKTSTANVEMIKLSPTITSPQSQSPVSAASSASTSASTRMTPKATRANNIASYERKLMVGTTLFNHKPERGIRYLVDNNFFEYTPRSIAKFLLSNKLLSKQMIADYISSSQDAFSRLVLDEFCQLINLSNLPVDEALRLFQSHFRMTGDAQKIEHLTRTFSRHYVEANKAECKRVFKCAEETVDVLAYAIILLNTTIHNPNVKPNERTKFEQFVQMTRNIDDGQDINRDYLQSLYDRVKQKEFKPDPDHVNDVFELEKQFVNAKKPTITLAVPYRRLVCSVKLFEIYDLTKKEKLTTHQRDVFLFNDLLVVTKIFTKKKSNTLYTFRCCFPLASMECYQFKTDHYQYGIRLLRLPEKQVLITFNARNKNDQDLFCHDLMEAIRETNEVEAVIANKQTTSTKIIVNKTSDYVEFKQQTDNNNIEVAAAAVSSSSLSASPCRFVDKVATTMKRTFSNSLLNLSTNSSSQNSYLNSELKNQQRTASQCSLNTIKSSLTCNNTKLLIAAASIEKLNTMKLTQIDEQLVFIKQSTSNYQLESECLKQLDQQLEEEEEHYEQQQQQQQHTTKKRLKSENLERQFSFLNSKSSSSSSTKSANYKYFTLSASAGKSLDKSIRSMFKYIGLYNNPKNSS